MMFITRVDTPEDQMDKLIAQMETAISGAGGKTDKVEKMGRRRLAYLVQKQRDGFYVLFRFEGTGDTVREFERRLKVTDAVIKYMSVRVDEQVLAAEAAKQEAAKQAAAKLAAAKEAADAAAAAPPSPEAPADEQAPTQN